MATYTDIKDLIDANLASGTKIPAIKHREVEMALLDYIQANLAQSGDIKIINCDLAYYTANFEVNGLGKNLRAGWAVCNGVNGTPNIAGKVVVGYGLGYSTFGATGGSKDAVVVSHTHGFVAGNVNNGASGGVNLFPKTARWDSGTGTALSGTTNDTGVDGTDRNMQPYIVLVYIMKL